jgi:hypothetical protein
MSELSWDEDTVWRGACGLAFGWCLVLALAHWWVSGVSCLDGSCIGQLEFISVFVLALTSIVLVLVGLGLGEAPGARLVQAAGLTATFATTLLVALLWL